MEKKGNQKLFVKKNNKQKVMDMCASRKEMKKKKKKMNCAANRCFIFLRCVNAALNNNFILRRKGQDIFINKKNVL